MADQVGDLIGTISHNLAAMGIDNEVSRLETELYWFHIENRLTKLFSRIEAIRQLKYRSHTDLESDQIKAASIWIEADPLKKEKIKAKVEDLLSKIKDLKSSAAQNYTSGSSPQGDQDKMARLKNEIATYKNEITYFSLQIQQDLSQLLSLLLSIEQKVSKAETALDLTSNASFKLEEHEALLIALKAKDLNTRTEGILTFTNQRMLFENLPTKKKQRQVVFYRPIDSINRIIKDKLGTFAPEGILVKFKNPSDRALRFAAKNLDIYLAVENFHDLASRKVEEDLKYGVNAAMRRRFKELAAMHFPEASFCRGTCKKCNTTVLKPIKTYIPDGGPIMGIFDCPKCNKPFKTTLAA